jgi:hypothetical protein
MTGPCVVDPTIDAPEHDASSTGVPLDMLASAELDAFCSRVVRCGVQEDMAICRVVYGFSVGRELQDVQAAVAAGKIIYHADRSANCLDFLANLSCDRDALFTYSNVDCQTTFEGTLTDGKPCANGAECVSQSCINIDAACGTACCLGTCSGSAAPSEKAVGQSCTTADICTAGYCSAVGICTAYAGNAATCGGGIRCEPGLTCHSNGTASSCMPLAETLSGCTTTNDCRYLSDVCYAGVCLTTGLTGKPCMNDHSQCQELHRCTPNGCVNPPDVPDSCAGYGFCQSGYCDSTTMACMAAKADDEACEPTYGGRDCTSGYCDTTLANPRCAPDPVCI